MRKLLWLPAFILLVVGIPWAKGLEPGEPERFPSLVEKKAEQLSSQVTSPMGLKAMAINPPDWKHAETEHFIIHYRRVTEAQRAIREIEYTLWFVAKSLGATKEQYAKKSHVYVFKDEKEWKAFLSQTSNPSWSASFAHRDELFLHIGGAAEGFNSHILAHETTHAVVARLYPRQRWPLWLNEGFAEYMGSASMAARNSLYTKGAQGALSKASLPLAKLVAVEEYPTDRNAVDRLYESSEKVVRFLMNNFPKDRFPRFIDLIVVGDTFENAVMKIYGDRVKDYPSFTKQYERFVK